MRETRGYLKVGNRQVFCSLYLPEQASVQWSLVIAEPFGEEKRCAARMLVRLARQLAEQQVAVLKFDFSGTGDSAGESGQAQWQCWQEELAFAAQFLKNESGAANLAVLGVRAGALLATRCAADIAIQALLLAEPILSGNEILDELEKRQRIKAAILGGTGFPNPSQCWEKEENADFAGFAMNPQFAEQLRNANLLQSLKKCPPECRILLLRVSGARKFPPTWQVLLELLPWHPDSQSLLIQDKPFWGQLEYYESDAVIEPLANFLTNPAGKM